MTRCSCFGIGRINAEAEKGEPSHRRTGRGCVLYQRNEIGAQGNGVEGEIKCS